MFCAINPDEHEICFTLGDDVCHDFDNYSGIDAVSLMVSPSVDGQKV